MKMNTSKTLPFVSIVVPVFNGAKQIAHLINRLENQSYPSSHYEILIVDDASDDRTVAIAQQSPRVTVIQKEKNGGSYDSRNVGINAAKGDIVAFTDIDCIPQSDWIEKGVAVMLEQEASIVSGKVSVPISDNASVSELFDANFFLRQEFYARLKFGATANLFVEKELFHQIGSFDETMRSGGDYEFCLKAARREAPFAYAADAEVVHPPRVRFLSVFKKVLRVSWWRPFVNIRWVLFFPRVRPIFPLRPELKNLTTAQWGQFWTLYCFLEMTRIICYSAGVIKVLSNSRRS